MELLSTPDIQDSIGYMKFVYKLHEMMVGYKLTLVYEGEINQDITKAFSSIAERKMDKESEESNVRRRVYHTMVECLQNICKHADDIKTGMATETGKGIFIVGQSDEGYSITTGNAVANNKVEKMKELLNKINSLNKEELKTLYKKQIKEGRLSEKGGAGLGLIDIAKKTGQKYDFLFETINEKTSFFLLRVKIIRNQ